MKTTEGRWAPVYDADDLKEEIRRLAERHDVASVFYDHRRQSYPCQGDIVELSSGIPLLNKTGEPRVGVNPTNHWLLIGNTCDLSRELDDSAWTQLVPIVDVLTESRPKSESDLRKYRTVRTFFLPPWKEEEHERLYVADLTRPVQIRKEAFEAGHAKVQATMQRAPWILLNACLVRFLARDDGRFET